MDGPAGRDGQLGGELLEDDLQPSAERYSNDHWNRAATAVIRTSVGAVASTLLRVLNENTNRMATMIVGMTVHTISSTLLPWICGGSSVSVGLRR